MKISKRAQPPFIASIIVLAIIVISTTTHQNNLITLLWVMSLQQEIYGENKK